MSPDTVANEDAVHDLEGSRGGGLSSACDCVHTQPCGQGIGGRFRGLSLAAMFTHFAGLGVLRQAKLDNIVEFLPLVPLPWNLLGGSSLDSPSLRVTLKHDFEVRGSRTVQVSCQGRLPNISKSSVVGLLGCVLQSTNRP